jgi:hypothetical protein
MRTTTAGTVGKTGMGTGRFLAAAIVAGVICGVAASAASATPIESVSVAPYSYTVGTPGLAQISLVNASSSGEIAEFEAIDLFPGCATAAPYCTPPEARDEGLFTLSSTGTGSGDAMNCTGTWEIVQPRESPGRWRLIPGRFPFLEAQPSQSCTVSFTATANRLPSTDVDPGAAGVQTDFVLDAHAYYNNGPIHSPTNFAEVTVHPGTAAPPGGSAPLGGSAAPTGQRAAALAKCKKKHSKKARKKCRKKALQLPA